MVIEWSDKAKKRLREIFYYYENEVSRQTATKIIKEIVLSVEPLKEFPQLAAIEPSLEDMSETFRSVISTPNYKVVYYTDADKINIVTIWDCRQNPKKLRREIKK